MKILMVCPYFYPKLGGLENYVYHISTRLIKNYKIPVVIITSNHISNTYKKEVIDGMTVYRLPYWFRLSNTPVNPLWYWDIKKIISIEKPDVINAHAPVPFISDMAFYAKQDTRYILTYHAGSMKKGNLVADVIIALYEKLIQKPVLAGANKLIAVSSYVTNSILATYNSKTVVVTPGVSSSYFTPKSKLYNKSILYVGKVEKSAEWKGLRYLIQAMKLVVEKYPEVSLSIAGTGDAVEDYKKMVKDYGLDKQVQFLGEKTGTDLVDLYQKNDVLVLPSTTGAESFGIVLIEAMACATPVIGSNVGGIPDVIRNNVNGLLTQPKSSLNIANAIERVITDQSFAESLGMHARESVETNYEWENQVIKYMAVINDVTT